MEQRGRDVRDGLGGGERERPEVVGERDGVRGDEQAVLQREQPCMQRRPGHVEHHAADVQRGEQRDVREQGGRHDVGDA